MREVIAALLPTPDHAVLNLATGKYYAKVEMHNLRKCVSDTNTAVTVLNTVVPDASRYLGTALRSAVPLPQQAGLLP